MEPRKHGTKRSSGDASSWAMPDSPLSNLHGVSGSPCAVQKPSKRVGGQVGFIRAWRKWKGKKNIECYILKGKLKFAITMKGG